MRRLGPKAIGLAFCGLLGVASACGSPDSSSAGDAGPSAGAAGSAGSGTMGRAGHGGLANTGGAPSAGGSSGSGQAGRSGSGTGGMTARGSGGAPANGGSSGAGGHSANSGGTMAAAGMTGSGGAPGGGGDAGWLYTKDNKIYVTGDDAVPWIGRGVNIDDIMFCGYNGSLWMTSPGDTYKQMISTLMSGWKPTFLRASLGMASFNTVSWISNPGPYKTPMLDAIKSIGGYPNTYVLVTVRSDKSMIGQWSGGAEATGMPSDAQSSPDKSAFPTGTDAVYRALVDDFKDDAFVLFGLTNEPGGNTQTDATLRAAMEHAVTVIREEEDSLGAHHHIVVVQGNSWTSNIGFYDSDPIPEENVAYEVHGYPPPAQGYTYAHLPVIIGEYGSLPGDGSAFLADLESKAISSLAWDYQPFSDCAPDLVSVTHSATDIQPNSSGQIVKSYLLAHAR